MCPREKDLPPRGCRSPSCCTLFRAGGESTPSVAADKAGNRPLLGWIWESAPYDPFCKFRYPVRVRTLPLGESAASSVREGPSGPQRLLGCSRSRPGGTPASTAPTLERPSTL